MEQTKLSLAKIAYPHLSYLKRFETETIFSYCQANKITSKKMKSHPEIRILHIILRYCIPLPTI